MSTSVALIERVQSEITPRDILMIAPPPALSLTVLDANALRRLAERERRMVWEEWLDVRKEWAHAHRAGFVECTRNDFAAVVRAAQQTLRCGDHYLLIEFV